MHRKLHNSLLALSAPGLLLAGVLLARGPAATPPAPALADIPEAQVAQDMAAEARMIAAQARAAVVQARAEVLAAKAEAQTQAFEAKLAGTQTAVDGIVAAALVLAAQVSADAALDGLRTAEVEAERESEAKRSVRKSHRLRNAFTVPYFSFARGLRRSGS
ncbi:hypothetical protein [Luteimonas aquatica]|uniref:hypothetical protein n=1 Tax=Luteimonas aquatica TaxID=450364 RepID=UPI001F576854|nr:hypothetical protein [Luteimonas aquatica]